MTRVFTSYVRVDWELASRLREWMVADGHEVFLDTHAVDGIQVGDAWEAHLHDRLLWADAMVCIVTAAYLNSPWCSAEIAVFRWERQGSLLPLNAELWVEHPLLRAVQGADYARDPAGAIVAVLRSLHYIDVRARRGRHNGVRLLRDRRRGDSTIGGNESAGGAPASPRAALQ